MYFEVKIQLRYFAMKGTNFIFSNQSLLAHENTTLLFILC